MSKMVTSIGSLSAIWTLTASYDTWFEVIRTESGPCETELIEDESSPCVMEERGSIQSILGAGSDLWNLIRTVCLCPTQTIWVWGQTFTPKVTTPEA